MWKSIFTSKRLVHKVQQNPVTDFEGKSMQNYWPVCKSPLGPLEAGPGYRAWAPNERQSHSAAGKRGICIFIELISNQSALQPWRLRTSRSGAASFFFTWQLKMASAVISKTARPLISASLLQSCRRFLLRALGKNSMVVVFFFFHAAAFVSTKWMAREREKKKDTINFIQSRGFQKKRRALE